MGRHKQEINKKTKLHIKFDAKDRRDYLKGFHKRKEQRRKKAQETIKKELKDEMKRIKSEKKDLIKKMIYNGEVDEEEPEVGEADDIDGVQQEEGVKESSKTLSVCRDTTVEISNLDLASSQCYIGANQMTAGYQEKWKDTEGEDARESDDDLSTLSKHNIKSQKALFKVLKQSSARELKKSKLMKMKQKHEGKKQRAMQRRMNAAKAKLKMKKKPRTFSSVS